jgi:putative intracellular protease/amidase
VAELAAPPLAPCVERIPSTSKWRGLLKTTSNLLFALSFFCGAGMPSSAQTQAQAHSPAQSSAPRSMGAESGRAHAPAGSEQRPRAKAETLGESPTGARKVIGIVLFNEYETLDVFGPVQMWGRLPDHVVEFVSKDGRSVKSSQGVSTNVTYSFANAPTFDVLMVPGGTGTRALVGDGETLAFLRRQSSHARWITSVCTGAALLAKAGILDGRQATTNKQSYQWVASQSGAVKWQPSARWVVDGRYVTSSGVSAGTDMALALVERLYDRDLAGKIAETAEYRWNDDPDDDPFAVAR